MKNPTCKFTGKFPTGTSASFTAQIPMGATVILQAILVKSFIRVMEEEFPNASERPKLRKMVITITMP